ncbi:MAG: hypothetical protein HY716_05655 [Planctomycetes bacterium]|nr:hypothetical protein [Planctomycetota bacterium]
MRRLAAVLGGVVLSMAARRPEPRPDTLYLFFTLDTPELARTIRQARDACRIRFRPVFLLDRVPRGTFEPPSEFLQAIGEVGQDVLVVDEEGLAAAREFGVRETPCAVRTGRRTHVAAGTRIDWKEFMSCERQP